MEDREETRVLVVDDTPEQRKAIRDLLDGADLEIVEAESGEAALVLLASQVFAVVLVDVRMPGMNGFELVTRIRSVARLTDLPIIFLTSIPPPADYVRKAYTLRAVDFLYAPLLPEALHAKVSVFVELSRKTLKLQRTSEELEDMVRERTADLEYQANLTRTLTDNASSGLFMVDQEGRVGYMNAAAARSLGFSLAEARGRNMHELTHHTRPDGSPYPASECPFHTALESHEQVSELEEALVRKDGRFILASCSLSPIFKEGRADGAVFEFRDITDQKKTEAALKLSESQREQARRLEALGRLSGGLAHDFNNCLTAINGFSSLSLEMIEPGSPLHKNLSEVLKAGHRAAKLTHELLAFSGQQVLASQAVNPNEILTGISELLDGLIGEKCRLRMVTDPEMRSVHADPVQFRLIILSLVINAHEAMPDGGEILVETRVTTEDEARTFDSRAAPARYAMISVRDHGKGMGEEVRSRIFDPFFTTKSFGRNSGLSLASVHGTVEQSGGFVSVESEPGNGSTFRVFLPLLRKERGDRKAQEPADTEAPGDTATILLVDDEPSVRRFASAVLHKHGYQVLEAADGAEALSLAKDHGRPIPVLLTDFVMPGLSGAEVAESFLRIHPDGRIIYMSGYVEEELIGKGFVEGTRFLQKPFSPDTLLASVHEALREIPA